jgi:hypothetical protein
MGYLTSKSRIFSSHQAASSGIQPEELVLQNQLRS